MIGIEQYKISTGYYDEEKIMLDGGAKPCDAAFDAIFGDVQGKAEVTAEYAAVLAVAREFNAARFSAETATINNAIATAYETNDWPLLVTLGAAQQLNDDGRDMYTLTSEGLSVLTIMRRYRSRLDSWE